MLRSSLNLGWLLFFNVIHKKMVTNEMIDIKAIVGVFGISLSVVLSNISVIVSIMVGIATLLYMVEKWLLIRKERKQKDSE